MVSTFFSFIYITPFSVCERPNHDLFFGFTASAVIMSDMSERMTAEGSAYVDDLVEPGLDRYVFPAFSSYILNVVFLQIEVFLLPAVIVKSWTSADA